MILRLLLCMLLFLLVSAGVVLAGDNSCSVVAVRIDQPPVVNGILSEEVWKLAAPAGPLTQLDPEEGKPASEKSDIRILYDDRALYIGMAFHDSRPEEIVARLTRRDDEIESDWASVRIDSYHDHQTCFEFTFNAAGVKTDIIMYDDGEREDASWDPVWDVVTQVTAQGWIAELRIPFAALRYPSLDPGQEQEWGINFIRYISRKQENERWAFTPKSESGFVSRFGHLHGLRDLPPPHRLEVLPFVVQRQEWNPPGSLRGTQSSHLSGSGGVDLKLGLASNFILDATVNPDFGQVEADPAVLNLTTFETFYPERRPFFVEGMQIFHFGTFGDAAGPGMFYSRRIGRAIDADEIPVPAGGRLVEAPQSAAILGAAKLTGKTSGGLSLGVLEAVTGREYAVVEDSMNRRVRSLAEPLAHFNVIRMKQDVLNGSSVGGILTSVLRERRRPALTGGGDWNLRSNNGRYRLSGFLAGSSAPDGEGTVQTGTAGKLELAQIAAVHWLWSLSGDFTAPHYDINDVGFFRRPNDVGGLATIEYKEDLPSDWARHYAVMLTLHERWNFDRANIIRQAKLDGFWLLPNYWSLSGTATGDAGLYDDRETRGNGLYRKPRNVSAEIGIESDERGDMVVELQQGFAGDSHGARQSSSGLEVRLRPVSWMNWEAEGTYTRVWKQEAWVVNQDEGESLASIFGDRTTHAFDLTLRGTLTFTRELTLQLYGQVFLARGHYEHFRRLHGTHQFVPASYSESPDFNNSSLNANVVLRWEYLPGSTLYLVWSHARDGTTGNYFTPLGSSLRETFALPATNVLMVKVSYWYSL